MVGLLRRPLATTGRSERLRSAAHVWGCPDDRLNDPTWQPVCDECGRGLADGTMKFIAQGHGVSLLTRIARLERITREAARRCSECGRPPESCRYRLEFGQRDWGAPAEPTGPERCPACGRQLVFRLEFDRQG